MIKPSVGFGGSRDCSPVDSFFLTHRREQSASAQENPGVDARFKPVITSEGWFRGILALKPFSVEFGDFQCPSLCIGTAKSRRSAEKAR